MDGQRDKHRYLYYEDLAQVILEAETSHDLPSAGWRPREAGGTVLVQTQMSENQGAKGINPCLSLKGLGAPMA